MNNPTHWGRLKVQDFFQGYNWSGRISPLEPSLALVGPDAPPPSFLLATVADFFAQVSWRGETFLPKAAAPASPSGLGAVPPQSLTTKVGDYFHTLPWQGNPSSYPLVPPVSVPTQLTPLPIQDTLDLTDLSGLF